MGRPKYGDFGLAKQWLSEARAIYMRNDDRKGLGGILNLLGSAAFFRNELDEARQLFIESIRIRQNTGERLGLASAINNLGNISFRVGDHDEAERCYWESTEIMREIRDERNLSLTLSKYRKYHQRARRVGRRRSENAARLPEHVSTFARI